MRSRLLPFVCLFVLSACGGERPVEWNEGDGFRWRELSVSTRGETGFEAVTQRRSRVDFVNPISREEALENRHLSHGSGVALGDVDGDGMTDLFFARLNGPNALFRNLGGWRFEDVTAAAGVAADDRLSTGAAFADVDGDADLDLVLSSLGGPNSIFVNDGTGRFTESLVLGSGKGSTTISLADVEGDGDLDLYIAAYKNRSAVDRYAPEERTFDRIVQEEDGDFRIAPDRADDYRVVVREDLGVVAYSQRAEPDDFYLNDGQGGFERVSFDSGAFTDPDGQPLSAEPDLFGLSARFYDVDGDLAPDLFVANDFEDPDHFWLNNGDGTFRAAPRLALRATSNAGMAVDFADVDRDGDVDFFEVDMLSMDRASRMRQVPTHTALPKQVGVIDDRPQMMRNTLFMNRGDATFAQVAELAGLDASGWSWGTMFLDVDLDGFEDVLVTNGHLWDIMDGDTQRRLGSLDYDWRQEFLLFPPLAQPNVAFRSRGDWTFEDASEAWGFASASDISHGIASGDLDGDGDLDVIVTRLNDPPLLLENRTPAPRVAVALRGRRPNTSGIGAKVRLSVPGLPVQEKEVTSGGMYLSGSEALVSFAAVPGVAHTLEVMWRDGVVSVVEEVRADRMYEVWQPESPSTAAESPAPDSLARPLFADASDLLNHRHVEADFDDRARQGLLPNALDRLGPGVTWYDVDGDGWEDLLVPSGRGGAMAELRNREGSFSVRAGPPASLDQTTVLPLPDGAGGTDVLVGQSSYEAQTPTEAAIVPSVLSMRSGGDPVPVVDGDSSSVGVMISADVDGDGDLDLFVGSRVLPGAYPFAGASRLYLREANGWRRDEQSADVLNSLGMVSSATFSDLDQDGDPDLLLAPEWGELTVLVNDAGRFTRAGTNMTLGGSGRWNGVATGDLDGDGRLDVVATSWGRNVRPSPLEGRPLELFAGDLDRDGSVDVVRAQVDEGGVLRPLERADRLARGIPRLGQSIPSLEAYASASLEDVFGPTLDAATRLEAVSYDHMLFLNRGDHFEGHALPLEAQVAPAFGVGVADLNGDGHEDVFMTQNFFPTEQDAPRLDGGRSLLLLGDGTGTLRSLSGMESGISVWGDARGAGFSDFDRDGRVDIAVAQNGAETRLFRNVGAEPGLRVRLVGPSSNPYAVGATLRLVFPDRVGAVREIRLGSGYWSVDGPTQVLAGQAGALAVRVRWPGGDEVDVPLAESGSEIVVRYPAG